MKKLFCFFSILLMFLSSNVYAESFKVKIDNKDVNVSKVVVEINEKELNTKFDSYTLSGRTFVPIREITESLGAKVDWDNKTRSATVSMENKQVKLQIDSDIVYVDGKKTNIEENSIPKFAVYLNPKREVKTMVPLRFLSETFGYEVKWDQETYTASIYTEDYKKDEKEKVVTTSSTTTEIVNNSNNRFESKFEKEESKSINNSNEEEFKSAGIDFKEEKKEEKKRNITKKIKSDGPVTIVIDPGHGGKDPGAIGADKTKEKDLTLEISTKLYDKLLDDGIDTHITRSKDEFVELLDRAGMANDLNAEIFLSIHINSAESSTPNGIEVFYPNEEVVQIKTVEQKHLANCLQNALIKETNATSRGVKNGSRLIVLKKTKGVSALAELGFISNSNDVYNLNDEEYQEKLVQGLYNGLKDYIDNYVE
ncbi:N-acetylmuramoyl-L-alanine amidase [Peptoniphilus stercorisuis]|uniref:N-acetylmuramoyl-L-alanine amidase n=1 Tax=Peptoniphilus stercorisuis TaxID=1436965 RepID=A0ABS4KBK9_9FIRM|nr:N-acetylmuramoyl-L-alanine amidase [Peptoniphilus stercorisuis]MBP2025162.1 N-acetylmuramoyl-L-alanine amidase [Peptoniphilus stercorisuis]